MPEFGAKNIVWLIPALPLLGFLAHAFLGKRFDRKIVGGLATVLVFASFCVSLMALFSLLGLEGENRRAYASLIPGTDHVPWISVGSFKVFYRALIDPLSILMCLIVTGVGGLIHLYATGYMAEDKDYSRFFTYLNLFIFFMLMLVLGENILLMFVGWEGVGLCSYLLISFWYEDVENSKAGNKAFIVNRIGDVGFGLGIMAVFTFFGTLTFYTPDKKGFLDLALEHTTKSGLQLTPDIALMIGLLLFIGACGKSAQFPLHVWLPDAMAGPTPVSALIHAATMVTAGVVMITRVSPIVVESHTLMTIIAGVGIFTAIFAATIALTQNDIKKVLAYSTVSQLGYMFLGCGVGAFSAGMFHVTTHAFFKALLFLGAGSVIHALSGEQDMRKMGGLATKIPITYRTMWLGWLAIAGIPPLAGFWSKDEILGSALGYPGIGWLFYGVGLITAAMTAFYMTRLMYKTFWGTQRFDEAELGSHGHGGHGGDDHHDDAEAPGDKPEEAQGHAHGVHESPRSMWIPLAILAGLSVVGGLIGTPWSNAFEHFMKPSVGKFEVHEGMPVLLGLAIGALAGAFGILAGLSAYEKRKATAELLSPEQKSTNWLYQGSQNLWYVDRTFTDVSVGGGGVFAKISKVFDEWVVDGIVKLLYNFVGFLSEAFRQLQTGYVRNYALMMLLGVIAVLGGLVWGAHNVMGK